MAQIIAHPTLGELEFPDDLPDDQIRAAINRLQSQETEAAQPLRSASMMRAMPVAGGGQMYPVPTPQEAARGLAAITEIGAPIAGTMVAGPAGGALGAGVGNTLAQAIRMGSGLQQQFKPIEAGAATAFGALAPGAATAIPSSTLQALGQMARVGAGMGTGGAGIQYAKTFLEEGRAPTLGEVAVPAALPAFMGAGGRGMEIYGTRLMDAAEQALQNFGKLTRAGITKPTPGQYMPERFAGMEARLAEREPTGTVAQSVQKSFEEVADGLQQISRSGQYEPANILQQAAKRAEERNLPEQLAKLGREVQDAQLRVEQATTALAAQRQVADRTVLTEQRRLADEALDLSLDSAVKNARKLASEKLMGGPTASPAVAAQQFKDTVYDPAIAAYTKHFDELYGVFDATTPSFDSKPFRTMAEAAFREAGKPLPPAMANLLQGEKVSWNAVRRVRENLYDLGSYSVEGAGVTRPYREAAKGFTDELNGQADAAFGPELGGHFRSVNSDYGRFSGLRKAPGMDVLDAKLATDDAVTNLVQGIKASGLEDYRMRSLMAFVDNLTKPQSAKILVQTERGFIPSEFTVPNIHPELASAIKGHTLDLIRGNILHAASESGRVVPEKMIASLRQIGNNKGALEAIGLGTVGQTDELSKLFAKYPSANQLTVDQWRDLWASPAFSKSWQSGETIASYIRPIVEASEITNNVLRAVFLEQQGKVKEAADFLARARNAAGENTLKQSQVQAAYERARVDPVFQVLQQPEGAQLSATSMRALTDTLFNPSSTNPVNNKFIADLTAAMRQNHNLTDATLLKQIQAEYLTKYLSEFGRVGPFERIKTSRLSSFTTPEALTANKGEVARARALLDPDQFDALRKVAEAAEVLTRSEAVGAAGLKRSELGRMGNIVKESWYGVADLIRRGSYEKAAQAIVNPKDYADRLFVRGDVVRFGGQVGQAAAGPLTSQFVRERDEQRRQRAVQGPSSLMQFAPAR